MKIQYKTKAVRVADFDDLTDERPFGICFDIYDLNNNFLESGTDWKYFETEKEAIDFCDKFNNTK